MRTHLPVENLFSAIPQFENLSPFRKEPGKVPLAVSLRNALFDSVFYDTSSLSNEEQSKILSNLFEYDEGGMLLVYPADQKKAIEYFGKSKELLASHPELDTVTIPGVGSSVIGAAALARQVADVIGRPAVGIISGYGAADVMSEALGGFFDFGERNTVRAMMAHWRDQVARITGEEETDLLKKYEIESTTYLADEPESNTLLNIMLRHADKLKVIVGHSKGALNIGNVLPEFVSETKFPEKDYENIAVVTFGCGVALPSQFRNVHQYVGTWDLLGKINTPTVIRNHPEKAHLETIERKGHSLALPDPMHMPVDDLLRKAFA